MPDDAWRSAFELMNGFRATALVRVAAQLRLPDLLAEGPRSSEELALEVGVLPEPLHRILRALATLGVVTDLGDRSFALTDVGSQFQDRPGSLRANAIVLPEQSGPAFLEIRYSVETGRPGYDKAHGQSRWEHLSGNPEAFAQFQAFMVATSERAVPGLLRAFDFSAARVVADVAGGHGGLLAGVLAAHPHLQGVLFDLPAALEAAQAHLASKGVADRCRLVAGDFFEAVPAGADAYLLKFILHDWYDDACIRILERCRAAMTEGSSLLVVERLLPDRATPADLDLFFADIEMMVGVGGRERTLAEFEQLFGTAKFKLERSADLGGEFRLLVARPA